MALFDDLAPMEPTEDKVPSYLIAANNHNIGNKNVDMLEGGEERSFANRAYNMVGSAAVSGLNSFYNTGQWIGNLFSDKDVEYRKTEDVIASFDEDMSKYYQANRETADLVGFVATSFIPGIGGVKVFQAGTKALSLAKGGTITANMSKGLGILPGSRAALVKEATETFATSRLPFSYKNPEVMKALSSGFGQNVLESLAFETAVAVTMKKSPILTDLDFGQTVSNMMWGAGLGGAIGGTLSGIGAIHSIKKGIKAIDAKLHGVTQLDQGAAGTRSADELLILRNDLDTVPLNSPEGVQQAMYDALKSDKVSKAENKSRSLMTNLAGGDADLGNTLYVATSADSTTDFASKFLGLEGVRGWDKVKELTKKYKINEVELPEVPEGHTRAWFKEGESVATATRNADSTHWVDLAEGVTSINPAAGNLLHKPTHALKYLKTWGENMGKLSDDAPIALHLADMGELTVKNSGVQVGKNFIAVETKKLVDVSKISYEEALARNVWAMDDTVAPLTMGKNNQPIKVHANDIGLLTKAYREGFTGITVVDDSGAAVLVSPDKTSLLNHLAKTKDELAQAELRAGLDNGVNVEQMANKYDTNVGYLTGEQYSANMEEAVMGLMSAQKSWFSKFHANSTRPPLIESVKPWLKSQNHGMAYDATVFNKIDGFQVDAMAQIRARQEVYKAAAENASASTLTGNKHGLLPDITEAELQKVNRTGAGPGFVSYTNSELGSIGQKFELIGSLVTKWTGEARAKVATTFNAVNYNIINSPADSVVLSTVLQRVRAAGAEKYVIDEGGGGLILKKVRDFNRAMEEGVENLQPPVIAPHVEEMIPVDSPAVMDWLKTHVDSNGSRISQRNDLRTAQGYDSQWDPEIVYAPAPNPSRFKHHAFVVDESKMVSQGDTTMLYATDATSLEKQMAEARAQGFNVYTPDQSADYYRARGLYDHALSLSENQFDNSLRASGSSAPAFPLTGSPQEMIQDVMQWHANQETGLIKEAVSTKYWREFGIIKEMGKEYDSVSKAQIGFWNKVTNKADNPYQKYLNLALGEAPKSDYPVWQTLNDFVENVGNKTWNTVSNVWKNSKSPYDIDQVNGILKQYGVEMPATKAQLEAWTQHPAGNKAVSEFIQTQNAVLSSLTLRLDPINSLNNAISSPILTLTEAGSWVRSMYAGNEELAGELAKMMTVATPGTGDLVRSPAKLMAKAYANYWGEGSKELLQKYKNLNVVTDMTDQLKNLMETATITGTETAEELASRRLKMVEMGKKLVGAGEKWTGNKMAEEMNRFVSANIADQITSPLVARGLMDEKTAGVYINTFVNRTQGNIIAAQRPQMFQGPVGQAIGLFQSYQFNFMQQLMRYVGEGSKKDAMMLMAMQGSIFGMNGLPAFQAINQHIIGTASGNTKHKDAYTSINNAVGKDAGDWITYGLASNMLWDKDIKINLYSRGDISPRQLTVVPTSFDQVPIFAAHAKVYSALKGSVSNMQNGGDVWNSMLGGIEQQGVSRPLAGFARVARGFANDGVSYSASGKGNIISANELYSFANLARLSGAKPFDEAIAQDAMFRIQAYQSKDSAARTSLGAAVKTVLQGGGQPTPEQYTTFMEKYVKMGGKQEEFAKWYVSQAKAATTPQVNKLLTGNHSEYMQSIMGGRMLKTPQHVQQELANQNPEQ